MGVIATEVAALEKQYAEATERASRLEKELAAARKAKTAGELAAKEIIPHFWTGEWGINSECGKKFFPIAVEPDDDIQAEVAECRRVIAAAIDKAIADEREACAKAVEGMLPEHSLSTYGGLDYQLVGQKTVATRLRARR